MARQEHEKENLMRDAVAFCQRAEWVHTDQPTPVFFGLKATGEAAIYLGNDPVYQFDLQGRLRRAFVRGELYRTQGHTLARLTRVRDSTQTTLEREDLTESELACRLAEMRAALEGFRNVLLTGTGLRREAIGWDSDGAPEIAAVAAIDRALTATTLAPALPTKGV